jgi:hypothetical protein
VRGVTLDGFMNSELVSAIGDECGVILAALAGLSLSRKRQNFCPNLTPNSMGLMG